MSTAVLLGGLLSPGLATANAASLDVGGLVDSAQLNTLLLVGGHVTDAKGAVPVSLMAWPSNDAADVMQAVDSVTLQPLAKDVTSSDGRFGLRLADIAGQLAPVVSHDGLVNMSVVAQTSTGSSVYNFARRIIGAGAVPKLINTVSTPDTASPSNPNETSRLI